MVFTLDTVTVQEADLVVSLSEVAVMMALPSAMAVTRPLAETVATASLLEVQVTVSGVTPKGSTEAVSLAVLPFYMVRLEELSFTLTSPLCSSGFRLIL